MTACWLTDIHLDFIDGAQRDALMQAIRARDSDAVLITGDISQAPNLVRHLAWMQRCLARPVYFVLGNHDYYLGSIAEVRRAVGHLHAEHDGLVWLNAAGVVPIGRSTALVGHDGWADGRLGDYLHSPVRLNDSLLIAELSHLSRMDLLATMQSLGDEAAAHLDRVVPMALAERDHVVVLTHVPPFREATWHDGHNSDDNWLPFFSCRAVGDVLRKHMLGRPDRRMTVLCGHTHGAGRVDVLPNLTVVTGGAHYGQPAVQRLFEWP